MKVSKTTSFHQQQARQKEGGVITAFTRSLDVRKSQRDSAMNHLKHLDFLEDGTTLLSHSFYKRIQLSNHWDSAVEKLQ